MQHTQDYFKVVLLTLALTAPAQAGTVARPTPPDPLLNGGETTACAAGVDYAAGTDVNGHTVVPADIGAPPVPVPDGIAVPLHGGSPSGGRRPARGGGAMAGGEGAYVTLDGRKLEPLLNPAPCR